MQGSAVLCISWIFMTLYGIQLGIPNIPHRHAFQKHIPYGFHWIASPFHLKCGNRTHSSLFVMRKLHLRMACIEVSASRKSVLRCITCIVEVNASEFPSFTCWHYTAVHDMQCHTTHACQCMPHKQYIPYMRDNHSILTYCEYHISYIIYLLWHHDTTQIITNIIHT